MELCRFLEEEEAGVGVHHVLDQGDEVLGHEVVPGAAGEEEYELRGLVVAALHLAPPQRAQLTQAHGVRLVRASRRQEHRALPVQREPARLYTGHRQHSVKIVR